MPQKRQDKELIAQLPSLEHQDRINLATHRLCGGNSFHQPHQRVRDRLKHRNECPLEWPDLDEGPQRGFLRVWFDSWGFAEGLQWLDPSRRPGSLVAVT